MKKLLSIFGILLFFGSFMISSCNSSARLCPAYPPSVYSGDVQEQGSQDVIETVDFQNSENL
ncbi:MAG: hypothetical protein L3J35_07615 [Bacteroidales bacterium]|nr:hypothetical protein [Bacteroidales bacterium]